MTFICFCHLFAISAACLNTSNLVFDYFGILFISGSNVNCWVDNNNNSKIIHKNCSLQKSDAKKQQIRGCGHKDTTNSSSADGALENRER